MTPLRVAIYYARAYAEARKNTVQILRKRIEARMTILLIEFIISKNVFSRRRARPRLF